MDNPSPSYSSDSKSSGWRPGCRLRTTARAPGGAPPARVLHVARSRARRCRRCPGFAKSTSPYFATNRRAGIDGLMNIVRTNSGNEFIEIIAKLAYRLDDDPAFLRAQLDGLVDFEPRFGQKCGGDAHRGAVAPFLYNHRNHLMYKQSRYDGTSGCGCSSIRRSSG